jgi:prepilin-type N-terminal cleavage/methylation domain-containing protein
MRCRPRSRPRAAARSNATRRRGVTLAELLVVLAILGVLLALALPRLAGAADRAAVQAALADAATVFGTARETAIYARSAVAVRLDTAAGVLRVQRGSELLLRRDLRSGYSVRLAATRDSMAYDPRGLGLGAANLSLIVRRGRAADTLFVSRLGRIRW